MLGTSAVRLTTLLLIMLCAYGIIVVFTILIKAQEEALLGHYQERGQIEGAHSGFGGG
jgi:hypothetical protein